MSMSSKNHVVVLRGGPSDEYEVSLKTGANALVHIPKDLYFVEDVVISKDGTWHKNGIPVTPYHALHRADVVFNALHGNYGEDGKVQHLLETYKIPFTGSGSFASAIGMNKVLSKEIFKRKGIKTPHYKTAKSSDKLEESSVVALFRSFPLPFIVKPVSGGSSLGVSLVRDFPSFYPALENAFAYSDTIIIEEYINGREAAVGIIEGFRDQDIYVLPPIEVRPNGNSFFDYDAKYKGVSQEIVPGNFSNEEKVELEKLAREVHEALGLRHYSRTDFIISPRRGIFVLEANTLPGLTEESLIPKALHAVGSSLSHFLDHLLQLAMKKR